MKKLSLAIAAAFAVLFATASASAAPQQQIRGGVTHPAFTQRAPMVAKPAHPAAGQTRTPRIRLPGKVRMMRPHRAGFTRFRYPR